MTAVEVILIVIGVILMMGSFFVTEKLSQKEVEQISKLSSNEMKQILEKNLNNAEQKVEELVDDVIDRSMEIADRALEKETNMKIQDISEYAESVMESIHKNHNEVMFLYNMLNDKHVELTDYAARLEKLKSELMDLENEVGDAIMRSDQMLQELAKRTAAAAAVASRPAQARQPKQDADLLEEPVDFELEDELLEEKEAESLSNNNQAILQMHSEGVSVREIARRLGLGIGEVKLVIDLYKGEAS